MNIYSALQIGDYHINHCEDYLFVGEIGTDKVLCAVMDGCTQAIDSYFAATLVGKILRKISVEKSYDELYQSTTSDNIEDYLKSILSELFKELIIVKNQLLLDKKELLTTLIILLLDKKNGKGIVLAIGDGLVCINGVVTEYDQENKPDYLGFHITEKFEDWYTNQKQKILFENAYDISIATDGIFMFKKVKKVEIEDEINALEYLIHDKTKLEKEDMLDFKLKKLERTYGLKPTDDLAVIRILGKTSFT
jgi:hypothetical protein